MQKACQSCFRGRTAFCHKADAPYKKYLHLKRALEDNGALFLCMTTENVNRAK